VVVVKEQDKKLNFDRKSSTGSGHTMGVLMKLAISDNNGVTVVPSLSSLRECASIFFTTAISPKPCKD
jgi:hypothetical protein